MSRRVPPILLLFVFCISTLACSGQRPRTQATRDPGSRHYAGGAEATVFQPPEAVLEPNGALTPVEVQMGLGTACYLNGQTSAVSFAVSDIGRPGVPKVRPSDLSMLHAIMRYVHTRTLRFVFLSGKFYVYDASAGLCNPSPSGYYVLNVSSCNEYYQPPLDLKAPHAVPGCWNVPRPWIPHDRGRGKGSWSHYPSGNPGGQITRGGPGKLE